MYIKFKSSYRGQEYRRGHWERGALKDERIVDCR